MKATLVEFREIAPGVRQFTFEAADTAAIPFTPGQFISFTEDVLGRKVTRAYSLASTPTGNRFELCLNKVEEGVFSPWIFQMKPGDSLEMRGPLGYFVPKTPFRDSVLIATGTGVAPFRAFLQSPLVLDSPASITLLFGARYEHSLLYGDEFRRLEATRPGFRYMPTLTRPEAGWPGRTGWVQQHIDEALAGRTSVDVYVCGLKAMVDQVRDLLKAKGFDRKQIIAEKYD